jgi:hypothetical protein
MVRPRKGIALPVVLLVLVALGLMSSLALSDALLASRVATLAEDELRARGAAIGGVEGVRTPPDLQWLCLQPPARAVGAAQALPDGGRVELVWWMVAPGVVRAQITGVAAGGGRHRRIAWLRPDSLVPMDVRPGCPDAGGLIPASDDWLGGHPEG